MGLVHFLHTLLLGTNVYVFLWHVVSPDSAGLPGQTQFGWFFRYLTFCSFFFQTVSLALFLWSESTKTKALRKTVDNLWCASFAIANMVTLMFLVLHSVGNAPWESRGQTPGWLTFHQHGFNSLVSLLDLVLAEPRTFSPGARNLLVFCVLIYCGWMQVCKTYGGTYPYPMFEKWPIHQCAAVFAGSLSFLLLFFYTGKLIKYLLNKLTSSKQTKTA